MTMPASERDENLPIDNPTGAEPEAIEARDKRRAGYIAEFKWGKGVSGNPRGRPKSNVSLTSVLKDILKRNPARARKIADKLLELCEKGNVTALELVMNRIDGKLVETTRVAGELPVRLVFSPVRDTRVIDVATPLALPAGEPVASGEVGSGLDNELKVEDDA